MSGHSDTDNAVQTDGRALRFVLWAGSILGVILAVARGIALRDGLASAGLGGGVSLMVRGLGQDWLVVLVLTLVFAALVRAFDRGGWGRGITVLFAVAAVLVMLAGLVNLLALRMLGAPLTMAWPGYSGMNTADTALHLIRQALSVQAIVIGVIAIGALLFGAERLSRHRQLGAPMMLLGLMAFSVITGFAQRGRPIDVTAVRLENPIVAFSASLGRGGGLDGDEEPFGPADPLPPPGKAATPIRNAIIVAFESVPASQTQGWGGTDPVTPNLKAALDRAMAFDNAYAHVPASDYSLMSILGGFIPELSPVSMLANQPDPDMIFLPDVMRANGMRTGFFSSSDNRFQNAETLLAAAGFEDIADYRDWDCETGIYEFASVTEQYLNTSSDLCTVKQIVEWIGDRPGVPFFLTFRTAMTHPPYFPGEDPRHFVAEDADNDYLNALRAGDRAFGLLMNYLEDSGLAEETLVVAVGTQGRPTAGGGIGEENIHVPMALINPQLFDGTRSDLIVGLSDIGPTIADILGYPMPSYWEGKSVFAANRSNGVMFFSPWNGFRVGYREGGEKFIYNGHSGDVALYDLATDPEERTNLAGDDPVATQSARDRMSIAVAVHGVYIDRLRKRVGAGLPQRADATQIEIAVSGTRYKSPPEGWVMLDDKNVGGFKLTSAPSNAERAVPRDEIDAALTTFHLPVSAGACPRRIEVYFLNDEWQGEGQTGNTDLFVRSVRFAGTTYYFNRFVPTEGGTGKVAGDYYHLWRKGGIRINLDLKQACLSAGLIGR